MSAALQLENLEPQFRMEELKNKIELTLEEAAFYLLIARRTFYNTWKGRGLTGYRDHRGRMFFKRADLDHYKKTSREVIRSY
jgi:excisionase family DNA binding protein